MTACEYSLLDSGNGKILEKIGPYLIARPYAKAIWKKHNPGLWKQTSASFEGNMDGDDQDAGQRFHNLGRTNTPESIQAQGMSWSKVVRNL